MSDIERRHVIFPCQQYMSLQKLFITFCPLNALFCVVFFISEQLLYREAVFSTLDTSTFLSVGHFVLGVVCTVNCRRTEPWDK